MLQKRVGFETAMCVTSYHVWTAWLIFPRADDYQLCCYVNHAYTMQTTEL